MLIQFEKKILEICNNKFKPDDDITFHELSRKMPGVSPKEIRDCCESLKGKGYFLLSQLQYDNFLIELTFKGSHYRQIRYAEIKDFLFKSVFVPIVVSAITALITLWLK